MCLVIVCFCLKSANCIFRKERTRATEKNKGKKKPLREKTVAARRGGRSSLPVQRGWAPAVWGSWGPLSIPRIKGRGGMGAPSLRTQSQNPPLASCRPSLSQSRNQTAGLVTGLTGDFRFLNFDFLICLKRLTVVPASGLLGEVRG